MSSKIDARLAIARAAIASSIASRLEVPVAGTDLDRSTSLTGRRFFTISSAMPAGYHMETELLPLEAIMRDVEVVLRSDKEGSDDGDRSLTAADHRLEEINAFVHDRLLNPILPVRSETPSVTALRPISEIYGETLRHASFAGSIVATSSTYDEAEAFLFNDGAPTEALETYRQYEQDVQDAMAVLNEIDGSEPEREREDAQRRLDRLRAEWIGIGQKVKVEQAFRTLQEETEAAGKESKRTRLLERFLAGEKSRIDAPGLSFYRVNLVPISPLFSEESGPPWQRVELDADAVRKSVSAPIQVALDISNEDIAVGVQELQKLAFEFVECEIVRDWLDTDFFTGRYWRLGEGDEPLSDGQGGGRLPAIPETVVFIRNAHAIYKGETIVDFGDDAQESASSEMATIQVLPVDDEAEEEADGDDDAELVEAAKSVGLSSSLDMLNRESMRINEAARGRVMAVQQQRLVPRHVSRDSDDSDASSGDGDSGGATREAMMSIRPSAAVREVSSERQARPAQANTRVRDQRTKSSASSSSGRSRLSRDNVVIRDHRSRSRSRSPGERRRRDHRDGDREHTRVPARRGQSARRRSITLDGRIDAGERFADRLSGVSASYVNSESDDQETTINLQRASDSHLIFSETMRDRSGDDELWIEFIIRDSEGDEIDRQVVIPGDDDETIELRWKIAAEVVTLELTGKLTPTLHGYQIRVLSESPNPDESLDWE